MPAQNFEETIDPRLHNQASAAWELGKSRILREGDDATIIAYGALAQNALAAAEILAGEGVSTRVIDARFCKPVDGEMLSRVLKENHPVLTLEDHALQNGFGSAVIEYANGHNLPSQWVTRLGHPDRLVHHATRKEQLAEVALDAAGIARSVRDAVRQAAVGAEAKDRVEVE